MEAYRDQYATLFNNGRGVVVLGISVDPDTTLINWFRELETPIMVMADTERQVSRTYQALNAAGTANNRHLYVIDKAGRVTYKALPFRVTVQDAYDELAAEVDKLSPPPSPPGGGSQ
jgi:peroxiredoxin